MGGKIAVVTGASRGIGKGIALGLGEAGWIVYVTSRTVVDGDSERPGSANSTAAEVTRLGGHGVAVICDHSLDSDVDRLFTRIADEQGHLDLLVNNATTYTTDMGPPEDAPFWMQPFEEWDLMHTVGLRSHFVASAMAARMMVPQKEGLIINVSSAGAIMYSGNVSYGVVKAGVDMLTLTTAQELRDYGVAVVSVWPRMTKTEALIKRLDEIPNAANAWTPLFNGRVVATLAADPQIMKRTGQALDIGNLANEYAIDDIDGRRPAIRTWERTV
jgi:dehydrogenase/reductase SDR family protein 1